ncbi:iron-containing alcohol dehydrogenase family protein [Orenia marismortui]|uniref:Alcohol dehydrogenase n=1 Tax=Orenia marismortui TaxID=46469 RepID=A0A4R8GTD3_9FIRM|nr:iron-containing alcohol dehydrogenase [Orenia marismortui]TDX46764.1 alcohol dehydrogenase [Orenia marismortui]
MFNFEYFSPTKIVFGAGKLAEIGQLINDYGNRALIVTDKTMLKVGILTVLEEYLAEAGIDYKIFSGVEPDPSSEIIDKGAKFAQDNNCEFIIALGGGSSIDSAKGISVASTHPDKIIDYLVDGKIGVSGIKKDILPIVAIPTTAGTGSEVTPAAVITDKGNYTKRILFSHYIFPEVAIVDPELTFTLPKNITVNTAVDALCQAIEAYVSPKSNFISDLLSIRAVKLIKEGIYDIYEDEGNLKARTNLSLGATLSGIVISQAGVGAAHAISMVLGAKYGISHGLGISMVLPYVVEYNSMIVEDRYIDIAEAWGIKIKELAEEEIINALVEELKAINKKFNIKPKLRDFNVEKDELLELARLACSHGDMENNPQEPELEKVKAILAKVF